MLPTIQDMLFKLIPEKVVSLEDAKILGEMLGYLPLALTQAIAMIRQENVNIKDYIETYQQKQKELLSANTKLFGKNLPNSIVTLYQLQLEKLKKECPKSIQLLQYSALLAPDAIPAELFSEGLLEEKVSPELNQASIQQLIRYAVWQSTVPNTVQVHRLIQEVVRLSFTEEHLIELFLIIAERITVHYNKNKEDTVLEKERRRKSLLFHLEALKTQGEKVPSLKKEPLFSNILFNIGHYYEYQTGQPLIAKPLFEAALEIFETHYGKDYPSTGKTLVNLGNTYGDLGDHQKEKELLTRALIINEAHYGPDHPSTGATLTNLGNAYSSLGDYAKQKELLTRALAIFETHYGKDHPSTGITLTNLGAAYGQLGDYPKSKELWIRALAINETHYGKDHPQTGKTLMNLGAAYGQLGDYPKQKKLLTRALIIIEAHYGPDHPSTGQTLMNLGAAYGALGDYPKQKELLTRALIINEAHYGPDHLSTGQTLMNLGAACGALGDYAKQKELLTRALIINEAHYGKDHPSTGQTLTNLGNAYFSLGDYQKSKELLTRALIINETHYGKDHPSTGITLNNLGIACFNLQDTDNAFIYQKGAYDIFLKFYGEQHNNTKHVFQQLQKINNQYLKLANIAISKNDLKGAINCYEKIIEFNPKLQTIQHNLGCYCFAEAAYKKDSTLLVKAEKCFQQAMALGEHSGICTDYANFLFFYHRYEETIPLLLEAIKLKADNKGLSYGQMEKNTIPEELTIELNAQDSLAIKAIIFAYYLLVLTHQQLGQLNEAKILLSDYSNAVKELENPICYSLLGYSYKTLELFDDAVSCFAKAYELKSDYLLAKQNRDECLQLAEKLKPKLELPKQEEQKIMEQVVTPIILSLPSDNKSFVSIEQEKIKDLPILPKEIEAIEYKTPPLIFSPLLSKVENPLLLKFNQIQEYVIMGLKKEKWKSLDPEKVDIFEKKPNPKMDAIINLKKEINKIRQDIVVGTVIDIKVVKERLGTEVEKTIQASQEKQKKTFFGKTHVTKSEVAKGLKVAAERLKNEPEDNNLSLSLRESEKTKEKKANNNY